MKKVVKRLVLPAVLAGLAMEAYQYLGEFSMSHEQYRIRNESCRGKTVKE